MHLVLFFTFETSLNTWAKCGLLPREMILYERYSKAGHDVSFLTSGDSGDREYLRHGSVSVYPVYERIGRSASYARTLAKSILVPWKFRDVLKEADVLKTNQMLGSWVAVLSKLIFRKPLILRCGYEWYRNRCHRDEATSAKRLFTWAMSWIAYHCADIIFISSKTDADYAARTFHVPRQKIVVHRNYIDTEKFSPVTGQPDESRRVLYVGRVTPRKNLLSVIRALSGSDFGLDIIGDGPQKGEMAALADDLDVDVRFLGVLPNDELPVMLRRYRVFILPSLYENNPKSLLEAMSCGLTAIGSDVEGIRELIEDGRSGFLCGTDPDSIRRIIQKVMEIDYTAARDIGRQARKFVKDECSIESIWGREDRVVRRLIELKGRT